MVFNTCFCCLPQHKEAWQEPSNLDSMTGFVRDDCCCQSSGRGWFCGTTAFVFCLWHSKRIYMVWSKYRGGKKRPGAVVLCLSQSAVHCVKHVPVYLTFYVCAAAQPYVTSSLLESGTLPVLNSMGHVKLVLAFKAVAF